MISLIDSDDDEKIHSSTNFIVEKKNQTKSKESSFFSNKSNSAASKNVSNINKCSKNDAVVSINNNLPW
jgi:hypothetical protein